MPDTGTFTTHPALAPLPPLVRKQRTLEAKILPLAPLVEDEKALRHDIDVLLLAAGLASNDSVTCNGYDVGHHERQGTRRLNQDMLAEQLVAAGLDRDVVTRMIVDCTETGDPALWATVKPCKGAHVRKGLTEKRRR